MGQSTLRSVFAKAWTYSCFAAASFIRIKLSSIDLYISHNYSAAVVLLCYIRNRVIVRIEDTDRRYTERERDRDKEEVGKVNTAAINQSILPINRSNWVRASDSTTI